MAFVAGQRLTAQHLNSTFETATQHAPLDLGTTTSTGFTSTLTGGTSPVFTTFTAPLSGKVLVSWAAGLYWTGSVATVLCALQVRVGTSATAGTIFLAAADNLALQSTDAAATQEEQQGRSHLLTGLTAGTVYNAAMAFRTTAGTGNFARKAISVVPVAN